MEHSMTLVVFTFLSQMSIGAFATLFILDVYKGKISKRSANISSIVILAISVVAVIVSIFHLGHPFAAYRALLNFGESWLTREIIFFPAFMVLFMIYAFVGKTKAQKQVLGWITLVLGVSTIFSTAMIYKVPAVPAWNNGTTIAAFFITAFLLGPVLIQVLLSILDKNIVNLTSYTAIMAILAIGLNIINLTILQGGLPAAVESATVLFASPLFWIKIVSLILALVVSGYVILKKKNISFSMVSVIFTCFLVSEFLGRMLFYSSGVHL